MDEIEQRIAAHELALFEVVAHIDQAHIVERIKAIRAGLVVGMTAEERAIRIAAIDLLEDAARRYDPPAVGMHWKAPSSG
jgi:DNA integrity scanning protein DisA with diadenylate cyclase activity